MSDGLQYARQYNFIYARKICAVVPADIFTKFTNDQRHFVQITNTEFHPTRAINMESMNRREFKPVSKIDFHGTDFHKIRISQQH
jgi:hypothetical protein